MIKETQYYKIYNNKTGAIQLTVSNDGGFFLEFAKAKPSDNSRVGSYDFENKIMASLTTTEKEELFNLLDNFDKDLLAASKKPSNAGKDTFKIDEEFKEMPHLESSTPKKLKFQRQVFRNKKQLTMAVELVNKTASYNSHTQSINESQFKTLKNALKRSIEKDVFCRADELNNFIKYKAKIQGERDEFEINLPNNISVGDHVEMKKGGIFLVEIKMYSIKDKNWKLNLKKIK